MNKITAMLATGYFMASVLTYGYVAAEDHHRYCESKDFYSEFRCENPGPEPFAKSLIWPIYWPYRLSMEAFLNEGDN